MTTDPSPTRRRRAAALTAAALAALTALVAPASPAAADVDGYEIVEHVSTTNSNVTRFTTAECPGDKELVGTGVTVFPEQTEVLVESVVPDLGDESVEVGARETLTGTGNSWQVRAYAVCAEPGEVDGRYLATDQDTASGAGTISVGAYAECDPGDRTLAGGFEFLSTSGRVHLTTLLPTEDGAMAVGQEDPTGTSTRWTTRAIALCADVDDSDVVWEDGVSYATYDDKTSFAHCPADHRVTGSGGYVFDETGASGAMNVYSFRPTSYVGGDYATSASNEPRPYTTAESTLYSYVICLDLD